VSRFKCRVSSVAFQVSRFKCRVSSVAFQVSRFKCRVSSFAFQVSRPLIPHRTCHVLFNDSLICVPWLTDMCAMTHWYVWHEWLIAWHDSLTCIKGEYICDSLICIKGQYICDSLICIKGEYVCDSLTCIIRVAGGARISSAWQHLLQWVIHVTSFTWMCAMTHLNVRRDPLNVTYVPCVCAMCMCHVYVPCVCAMCMCHDLGHDSFECNLRERKLGVDRHADIWCLSVNLITRSRDVRAAPSVWDIEISSVWDIGISSVWGIGISSVWGQSTYVNQPMSINLGQST